MHQSPSPEMVHEALPLLSVREAEVVTLLSGGLTAAALRETLSGALNQLG